jgi:[ribosomal protein S5]-alanine N-acetyltransferase
VFPSLQTDRLLLRRFGRGDAPIVAELANDREVALNTLLIPYPYSIEDALHWIARQEELRGSGETFEFAITRRDDSVLLGAVGLVLSDEKRRGEIGFWIGRRYWGKGYCTEAAHALLKLGFEQLGVQRIFAYHFARNAASRAVLQKLGMQHEGVLRKHVSKWGEPQDMWVWGILRHEFQS